MSFIHESTHPLFAARALSELVGKEIATYAPKSAGELRTEKVDGRTNYTHTFRDHHGVIARVGYQIADEGPDRYLEIHSAVFDREHSSEPYLEGFDVRIVTDECGNARMSEARNVVSYFRKIADTAGLAAQIIPMTEQGGSY